MGAAQYSNIWLEGLQCGRLYLRRCLRLPSTWSLMLRSNSDPRGLHLKFSSHHQTRHTNTHTHTHVCVYIYIRKQLYCLFLRFHFLNLGWFSSEKLFDGRVYHVRMMTLYIRFTKEFFISIYTALVF